MERLKFQSGALVIVFMLASMIIGCSEKKYPAAPPPRK